MQEYMLQSILPTLKRAARRHFAESLALVNHLQWFQDVSGIPVSQYPSQCHQIEISPQGSHATVSTHISAHLSTSQHLFISNPGWHSIAGSAAEFSSRVRGGHLEEEWLMA